MKNFDKYIIEKLKVTKNNKELTLGDIYKINSVFISSWFDMHPNIWVKTIDDIFKIDKLYELQNEYTGDSDYPFVLFYGKYAARRQENDKLAESIFIFREI